jgi:hypothetical protein
MSSGEEFLTTAWNAASGFARMGNKARRRIFCPQNTQMKARWTQMENKAA